MAKVWRQSRYPSRRSSHSMLLIALLTIFLSVVLILLSLGIVSLPSNTSSSSKSYSAHDLSSMLHTSVHSVMNKDRGDKWVEIVSWEPRAFVYHNFLSKEECAYLIDVAKPHMGKSMVIDNDTGKSMDSLVRTSSGAFLKRGQDRIIRNIEQRIADWTFIPANHGEGLHVLHYKVGEKYEPHLDYFTDEYHTKKKNGDQRMATVLMYLSDVEEGGETIFPLANGNHSAVPYCGKEGLSVKPKMGEALLFWSMKPDATLDPLSLHGACPVIRGNKWSCTKWMHVNKYEY